MDEEVITKISAIYSEMKRELQKIKNKENKDDNELCFGFWHNGYKCHFAIFMQLQP